MLKYMIKRILLALLTILIICMITFFAMHAVPGGPFNREKALSQATVDALNARYGLDKPLFTQFINYMKGLLKGDFGVSLKNGREISDIIAAYHKIGFGQNNTLAWKQLYIGGVGDHLSDLFR